MGAVKQMRFAAVAVLAAVVGAAQHASANGGVIGPVEAFERFGLFGTWSPDCSRAPSRSNPRVTWGVVGDTVVHTVTFDGRTVAVRDLVASADILNDHDMRIVEARGIDGTLTVIVRMVEDHVWSLRSVGPGGRVFVANGVDVTTGQPSMMDERCGATVSYLRCPPCFQDHSHNPTLYAVMLLPQ